MTLYHQKGKSTRSIAEVIVQKRAATQRGLYLYYTIGKFKKEGRLINKVRRGSRKYLLDPATSSSKF